MGLLGLLKNLRILHKLILIVALLLTVSIWAIVYNYLKFEEIGIGLAERERLGVEYLVPGQDFIRNSILFRDAAERAMAGDPQAAGNLRAYATAIEEAISRVTEVDQRLGEVLARGDGADRQSQAMLWRSTRATWIKARTADYSPGMASMEHTALADAAKRFASDVGDTSYLILDPDLDSYYCMATAIYTAPPLFDDLGRLRVLLWRNVAKEEIPRADIAAIARLQGRISLNFDALATNVQTTKGVAKDKQLASRLDAPFAKLKAEVAVWTALADAAVESGRIVPGEYAGAKLTAEDLAPGALWERGTRMIESGFVFYDENLRVLDQFLAARLERFQESRPRQIAILTSIYVVIIVVIGVIGRFISRQVRSLTDTFEQVGRGNLAARAEVLGRDELGTVAGSLNDTLARLQELVRERDEQSRQLQEDLAHFLEILKRAAAGDMRVSVEARDGTIGTLAQSFNLMIRDLGAIIAKMRLAATQVATSTQEILVSAGEMARGAEDQALQIANTTSAVDEMSVSVRRVAENADAAAKSSNVASSVATEGGATVRQSIAHMSTIRDTVQETAQRIKALGESSLEIGEIVKVINAIANRTNLLALNATIEAAKAGESGKGFAVVADEVRKLADQASKASNDIATLIQGIQADTTDVVRSMERATREVSDGVRIVDRAGQALERIVATVNQSEALITEISLAAKQQALASEGIVEAMNLVSRISRESANGANQTKEASHQLMKLSEDLRSSVLAFKLKE
jgi:twitching motility protein PilJ